MKNIEIGRLYRYERYPSMIIMVTGIKPYNRAMGILCPPQYGGLTLPEDKPLLEVTFLYQESAATQVFTEKTFYEAYVRAS